ncbi:MAG: J domain-containing protein [Candidatus Kapaibacteriota bacterium]
MGQLFNRFKNYIKSELNSSDSSSLPPDFDFDELNKEFEKLNEQKDFQSFENKKNNRFETNETNIEYKQACMILEVDENASVEEIKIAYRNKIKEHHPDKVQNMSKDIRQLAEKRTVQIIKAYEIIKQHRNFN